MILIMPAMAGLTADQTIGVMGGIFGFFGILLALYLYFQGDRQISRIRELAARIDATTEKLPDVLGDVKNTVTSLDRLYGELKQDVRESLHRLDDQQTAQKVRAEVEAISKASAERIRTAAEKPADSGKKAEEYEKIVADAVQQARTVEVQAALDGEIMRSLRTAARGLRVDEIKANLNGVFSDGSLLASLRRLRKAGLVWLPQDPPTAQTVIEVRQGKAPS